MMIVAGEPDLKKIEIAKHPQGSLSLQSEKGFTLVELIAVTILLSMLSLVLYGTLDGIIEGRQSILNRSKSAATARTVVERLSRELSNKSIGLSLNNNSQNQSSGRNLGSFQKKVFEGKNNGDKVSLRFISTGVAQSAYGAFGNYGAVELSYSLKEDPEQDEQVDGKTSFLLVREEQPAGSQNKDILEKNKVTFPIASGISSMKFRFLDNKEWVEEWKKPALFPHAVEITVTVLGKNGDESSFRTAVATSKRKKGLSSMMRN